MEYHFSNVALLVTHYNRSLSLERLLSAFKNLGCSFNEIVVSDDCSKPEHLDKVKSLQEEYGFQLVTTPRNGGLGNNINKGQDAIRAKYTLYVQEDFIPTELFPDKLATALALNQNNEYDLIRFYAYQRYPYLKDFQDGFSKMKFGFWKRGYKKYYFYSDHPHLRVSTFFDKFGRYAEGLNPEQTEYRMMISVLQKKGKALFYNDYKNLLVQSNSIEPSTMKRVAWKRGNNILIVFIRTIYRNVKFSFDYLFMRT